MSTSVLTVRPTVVAKYQPTQQSHNMSFSNTPCKVRIQKMCSNGFSVAFVRFPRDSSSSVPLCHWFGGIATHNKIALIINWPMKDP